MEGYYQAQASMPYFSGAARQRGSGIGSLALSIGRTALPIIKKFILPAAKRVGRDLVQQAIPEAIDVISGRTKPKQAFKRVAKKTITKLLGGKGRKRKAVRRKRKSKRRSRADILEQLPK